MSVEVYNLSKVYGKQKALNGISFKAKQGEILGFLGPNGAGKSTTMKIATGFLSASGGSVTVAGYNVAESSMEARAAIGYLPEHNPLYLDMFVHEYLSFSGKVYGLKGNELTQRVSDIVRQCGLTNEQNKKVGALSKGYRQRVGLAQALLHDPQVLILDEPTTGLDPNQILEIRKLIRNISKNKTVIFSTHIMQEVQALCDHVIIINKGEIVADKPINELSEEIEGPPKLKVEFTAPVEMSLLKEINGVEGVHEVEPNVYVLDIKGTEVRSEIFKIASEQNLPLAGLQEVTGSLEDVFHALTQE